MIANGLEQLRVEVHDEGQRDHVRPNEDTHDEDLGVLVVRQEVERTSGEESLWNDSIRRIRKSENSRVEYDRILFTQTGRTGKHSLCDGSPVRSAWVHSTRRKYLNYKLKFLGTFQTDRNAIEIWLKQMEST